MSDSTASDRQLEIGMALRRLRERNGRSAADIAEALGLQRSAGTIVLKWERGEVSPSIVKVDQFLRAVRASFFDLERELPGGPLGEAADDDELHEILLKAASLARKKSLSS